MKVFFSLFLTFSPAIDWFSARPTRRALFAQKKVSGIWSNQNATRKATLFVTFPCATFHFSLLLADVLFIVQNVRWNFHSALEHSKQKNSIPRRIYDRARKRGLSRANLIRRLSAKLSSARRINKWENSPNRKINFPSNITNRRKSRKIHSNILHLSVLVGKVFSLLLAFVCTITDGVN